MIMKFIVAGALALPFTFVSRSYERREVTQEQQTPRSADESDGFATVAPAAWADQDPADSLYRAGREALNRGDYRGAASIFADIAARYPRSDYAPDALYWRAFALYRSGRDDDLREALRALETQKSKYPKAKTIGDANALAVRIQGTLAQQGDVDAAEKVTRTATANVPCTRGDDSDEDIRAAAMNALLQMDAEGALPIIKQVLARRDECSVALREKAVFLLSQKQTSETEDLMINVVKNDPSQSVREQAVFWLGQVQTDKAEQLLEQIATTSTDMTLREKAVFALSQQGSSRGFALLRRLAESADTPESVREQTIFWIGQRGSAENADFLKGLFGRLGKGDTNEDLRKKVLFSLSQMKGFGNDRWLLAVATDTTNSEEVRGHALWTAGQNGVAGSELAAMYDRLRDDEVKEKLIWVLSESDDAAATDKLVDIAQKDPNREMRKKALFWLGQKNDPRVRKILTDILTKP
ncbi:MAG TPA: HEAT repeat domain-containing protein [Gemmatimonadaceae bacterium]|nr:HEAT repeat domain-containing protein [Gemmatimonadaceae bacterium]